MARKPKAIEVPGDVTPAEPKVSEAAKVAAKLMAKPEPEAPAPAQDNAKYITAYDGTRYKIVDRSGGWVCLEGAGWHQLPPGMEI